VEKVVTILGDGSGIEAGVEVLMELRGGILTFKEEFVDF
jgi:hypothetical protein